MQSATALIALGANLPHEGVSGGALLAKAIEALQSSDISLRRVSSVWETEPQPPSDQPNYFNAAAELDVGGATPQQLYAVMRRIEHAFGRERRERWGARTLDLDILAIDNLSGVFGEITLPHSRMHQRAFVLAPLAEIAPDWRHPILGKTVSEMLTALPAGQGVVRVGPMPL